MQEAPKRSHIRAILRRLGVTLMTLLLIAYLTLFGLIVGERGREKQPADPIGAAGEALVQTASYVVDHSKTYYWDTYEVPAFRLVAATFGRSAALLLLSLGAAVALGIPLGIAVALARRKGGASLVLLLSILGVSTPSFLFAMALWALNFHLHRQLKIPALPPTGFGWDTHVLMPALVLAARPLAQIAQVTYVSLSDVLAEDYVRTARAKGLPWNVVRNRHALRNVLIPVLTTLGTSLRFSLASLPVVEYFFIWPGVGLMLLEAIQLGMNSLVTDLIVSLGLFFLTINLALEVIYPFLDPRLRNGREEELQHDRRTWRERLTGLLEILADWWIAFRRLLSRRRDEPSKLRPLPVGVSSASPAENDDSPALPRARWLLRAVFRNPALPIGALLVVGFFVLALVGESLTSANPYEIHGVMIIEGEIGAPPYPPSSVFPWGTDHLGRDLMALVLAGAKQTLALALFGMTARVLAGIVLGTLAGWWQGGWLDRFVTGAVGVWAAFPFTLFAMIVIQALGIQQGMWVFVVALCIVGWGEVAQFIRGQVISIKPRLYIQASRAAGAHSVQILTRHVLPNLLPSLLVLAVLEMGGVLMLLAELGFLSIFLGGGFRVEIAEVGKMVPVVVYFSDVPEWGALLATIRDWWRSYPWMAWYPGAAFFLAIVAFNVWGEGLRRFLAESRVNINRLLNRNTALVAGVLVLGLVWMLRVTAPLGVYRAQARQFDAEKAVEDIRALASPEFEGRETGTAGAERAAAYITQRMKEIGLAAGGEGDTYVQAVPRGAYRLVETPHMAILDDQGEMAEALAYGEDFVAYAGLFRASGECQGRIVGLTTGALPGMSGEDAPSERSRALTNIGDRTGERDHYGLRNLELWDKVIVVREAEIGRINVRAATGALIISSDPDRFRRRDLFGYSYGDFPPVMCIAPEVADRLLATAGSSLDQLERMAADVSPGEVELTEPGVTVRLETSLEGDEIYSWEMLGEAEFPTHTTVIGVIPGTGAAMGTTEGIPLSNQAIIVSAYYDGVGVGVDGTLYQGANDNASGVATMLEIARVLKEAAYPPKRTVVFVAWPDGQRYEGLSVSNVMNAQTYLRSLDVKVVIELGGVGAGSGEEIALGEGSSFRLAQLFQKAADRMGSSITTRGRGPHHGMFTDLGYGGRSALSAYVSWNGSDQTAHFPEDTVASIDRSKLEEVGQTTLLALTVLSRELEY